MTKEFNLKDVEIGDTVHFRCGGSAEVTRLYLGTTAWPIGIRFKHESGTYMETGQSFIGDAPRLLDILKVTRPASVTVVMERE